MPVLVSGFMRDEFIEQLQDVVGNNSSDFRTYLQKMITAWQFEFNGMHDWSYLHKSGEEDSLSFQTTIDEKSYTTNTATVGFEMDVSNIETIYTKTADHARVLTKVSLEELKKWDPGEETPTNYPTHWAPYGRQGVIVYPTPHVQETFYIDGKVDGAELYDPSNPATDVQIPIPYKRQSCFFQFCLYKALQRERDPSAEKELQVFQSALRVAVADDTRELMSTLRIKSYDEMVTGDRYYDLDTVIWNS